MAHNPKAESVCAHSTNILSVTWVYHGGDALSALSQEAVTRDTSSK